MGEFLLKPGSEPISDLLLAFLRVFSMRKPELTHWLRSDRVYDLKHIDCALETVVEENVRKFLLTRLQLLIANYPTSLKVKVKRKQPRCFITQSDARTALENRTSSRSFVSVNRRICNCWKHRCLRLKKLAIQLRVTEKRILLGALEYVEQWIKA